ncbi:MAG: ankyrin repeat domain-containing protein [Legionella sp.]|uniref:ankyrin repeat domain-containing protein n=1 Tax=Legionella sp. TaxID=459 RepID=UPI00283DAA44|nr:ankyrin repeat domain-containing protein [Legionella sp.]
MTKLTHVDLYKLGKLLDYQLSDNGLCHGFTLMMAQAILAEDEQSFFERLDLIASYKPLFNKLKEDIEEAKKKVQSSRDQPLDEKSEKLLEILALFDGIELYLAPNQHVDLFDNDHSQEDLNAIYPFISSKKLTDTKLTHLLNKPYAFDKQNLKDYLNDLAKIFNDTNTSPPIMLRNINHSICLKYNKTNGNWLYVDINDYEQYLEDSSYFRNLSREELADSIFKSFVPNECPHVVMNMEILTTQVNHVLQSALENLHAQHPITSEQAKIHDHLNTGLLFFACRHGHLDVVKDILKYPDALVNATSPNNETPLLIACAKGYLEIVQELLKHPDTAVNESNVKKQTPLLFACVKKYTGIVRALLERTDTLVNESTEKGEAPLHLACQNEDSDTVQVLLDHKLINVNQVVNDQNKKNPVYIACEYGCHDIVQKLIEREDILIDQGDAQGITPLCVASSLGYVDIVRTLVPKANINQPSDAGNTPLHYACASPNLEENQHIIQLLLDHGASLTDQNQDEETALDVACASSNSVAIYMLLKFTLENRLDPDKVMSLDTFEDIEDWITQNLPAFITYMRQVKQQPRVSDLSFFNHTAEESEVINDTTYDNNNMEKK